jgi:mono/diheme cytochrome c family protein
VRPDPRFLAGDLAYDRGLASRDEKPELGPDGNPTGRMVPDWLPTIPLETFLKVKNRVLPHGERERLGKLVPEERDTAIRLALVRHGRDKYSITCLACHGATGGKWGEPNANGITTLYGMNGVANYHQNRLREMPDGEIYNTITYGKNTMMGYGHMLRVEDRWAVVAYVRALQRAMLGAVEDVPENLQAELK